MKIVHISPNAPFNDGWGFQENLLPKYQAKAGHDVTLIVSNQINEDGKIIYTQENTFKSVDGFNVIRLQHKEFKIKKLKNIFYKFDILEHLIRLQPDFIFYHGLVSITIFDVIRYVKNQQKKGKVCTIVQDNHLDYNIGNDPKTFNDKILRAYYRLLNKISQKNVSRVYGVTPWRKQYAQEYYNISPMKTDVLIMGADDESIDFKNKEKIREEIRKKFGISDDEFLIVTGGKIDEKKKIHLLMEACGDMQNVKLLIFGNVMEQFKEQYEDMLNKYSNIISLGWISSDKVYDYFFASDLVCFPGQHSVLWEQACAAKVPCIFARWPGMDHVDNGGNADFIEQMTVESVRDKIQEYLYTDKYYKMKEIAHSDVTDIYLYSKIAIKSLSQ